MMADSDENMVTVRLDKRNLAALRDVVAQMHAFAESQQENLERGDYHAYDYGMTDWREDIALAAEGLLSTIKELAQ